MGFTSSQAWKLQIDWLDRNGQTAVTSYWLPLSLTSEQALAAAFTLVSLIQDITTAACTSYKVYQTWRETDAVSPDFGSDVTRLLAVYYRNETKADVYHVPSPRSELLDTAGTLVGIRVNYDDPAIASIVDQFTAAITPTVTPDGQPWPKPYIVGGLAQ